MTDTARRSRRSAEPAVLAQEDRYRRGVCIVKTCGKPTNGTRRCRDCEKRIDENSNRYRGHGSRGRMTKGQTDLVDMKFAGEAWSKAYTQLAEIERKMPMSPRKLDELRAEPLAQIAILVRFGAEILFRTGETLQTIFPNYRAPKPTKIVPPSPQLSFTWGRS
jgi:hypothetical protein